MSFEFGIFDSLSLGNSAPGPVLAGRLDCEAASIR